MAYLKDPPDSLFFIARDTEKGWLPMRLLYSEFKEAVGRIYDLREKYPKNTYAIFEVPHGSLFGVAMVVAETNT